MKIKDKNEELKNRIKNLKPYENLKMLLGDEMGEAIYKLVNSDNANCEVGNEDKLKLMEYLALSDNAGVSEELREFESRLKAKVRQFNVENKTRFQDFDSFCDYLEYAGYE